MRGSALRSALLPAAALLLLIGAGVAAAWQVEVDDGGASRACGSVIDAVTGRARWQEWWAADVAEPTGQPSLVRTRECPGAENRRLLLVGGLVLAAVTAGAVAVAGRRTGARAGATDAPRSHGRHAAVDELRSLGRRVAVVGAALAAAGVCGLALLLADPDATLFVYVSRSTVALLGALALVPALALVAAGRAIELLARSRAVGGGTDASS